MDWGYVADLYDQLNSSTTIDSAAMPPAAARPKRQAAY
jgi:hypothetical protein